MNFLTANDKAAFLALQLRRTRNSIGRGFENRHHRKPDLDNMDTEQTNTNKVAVDGLRDLRNRLLHLHKILLELERRDYEKVAGHVNAGALLQLLITDPQFAWLRMISALVVEIDEALDGDQPVTLADGEALTTQARRLLTSSDNEDFRTRYQAILQREPDVVMAHSAVMQLVREGR